MKRIYLKPETRTLQLRLNTFITAASGNGTNYGIGTEGGGSTDPITEGGSDDAPSRSWGRNMWDDMK